MKELDSLIKDKVKIQDKEFARIIECIVYPKNKSYLCSYTGRTSQSVLLLKKITDNIKIDCGTFDLILHSYTNTYVYYRNEMKAFIEKLVNDKNCDITDEQYNTLLMDGFAIPYKLAESYSTLDVEHFVANIKDPHNMIEILQRYNGNTTDSMIDKLYLKSNKDIVDLLLSKYNGTVSPVSIKIVLKQHPKLLTKYKEKFNNPRVIYYVMDDDKLLKMLLDNIPFDKDQIEFKKVVESVKTDIVKNHGSYSYIYPDVNFGSGYGYIYSNDTMSKINHAKIEEEVSFKCIKLLHEKFKLDNNCLKYCKYKRDSYLLLRKLGLKPNMDVFRELCGSAISDLSILNDCINYKLLPDEQCMINATNYLISNFLYLRNQGGPITDKVLDAIICKISSKNLNQFKIEEKYHDMEKLLIALIKYCKYTGFKTKNIFSSIQLEKREYMIAIYDYVYNGSEHFDTISKYGLELQEIPSQDIINKMRFGTRLYYIMLSLDDRFTDYILDTIKIRDIVEASDETKRYYHYMKSRSDEINIKFDIDEIIKHGSADIHILNLLKLTLNSN